MANNTVPDKDKDFHNSDIRNRNHMAEETLSTVATNDRGLSPKGLENLKINQYIREFESGLRPILPLAYSTYALFDPEAIERIREEKEVEGKMILTFRFRYIIGVDAQESPIGLCELVVDSKTSEKIDGYLSEGINILYVTVSRTTKGLRYKVEPFDPCPSDPGSRIALPPRWYEYER